MNSLTLKIIWIDDEIDIVEIQASIPSAGFAFSVAVLAYPS